MTCQGILQNTPFTKQIRHYKKMHSFISFIIVLGVLIFVHELGHFMAAKLLRVKVLKFSLGFGPRIIGRKLGETEYILSVLPLGGYVKMLGEGADEELEPEDEKRSFATRPVWQRFAIVLAGPTFNLLAAVLFFFIVFAAHGIPEALPGTTIAAVSPGSPAMAAGIMAGDEILSINEQPVNDWDKLATTISQSKGASLALEIKRGTEIIRISTAAREEDSHDIFGEVTGKRYMLGISRKTEVRYRDGSLIEAVTGAVNQTVMMIYLTIMGVMKMIQRVIPASQMGGPILIAQLAGQQFEAGWFNLLHFMGVISVNLGIINLFPIPVLDGGHLMFFSIEAIRGKPLNESAMEMSQRIGLALLISLMIFVFYNDLVRIFTHH